MANSSRGPSVGIVTVAYRRTGADRVPRLGRCGEPRIRRSWSWSTMRRATGDATRAQCEGRRCAHPAGLEPRVRRRGQRGVREPPRRRRVGVGQQSRSHARCRRHRRALRVGEADPSIGAVGPADLNPDRVGVPVRASRPVAAQRRRPRAVREPVAAQPLDALRLTDPSARSADAGWLSGLVPAGPALGIRRVGGFDEGYFMYFEDVDLGARLGKAGYRNVYEPAAEVTHVGAHSHGRSTADGARPSRQRRRFLVARSTAAGSCGRCASTLARGARDPLARDPPSPAASEASRPL